MKERLNYVDALRGLTMVSVVMVHVLVRGFGLDPNVSGLAVLRSTFTLPLFFFISGFFAWRPAADYGLRRARRAVVTRIKALLFGTIIFDTLYLITLGKSNPFAWTGGDFDSYWYTFTLLQIFICFMLTVGAARLLRSQKISWIMLIVMAIAGFVAHYFINYRTYQCYWLMAPKTMEYLQFFVVGCAVRSCQSKFFDFLRRPGLLTILIVVYVGAIIAHYYYGGVLKEVSIWLYRINNDLLCRYAGLLLVLWIFHSQREYFDRETALVRAWRFIGRRTLDIYFLHYFFIPQMRWVGPYLKKGNTFILQFISAFVVALVIIAITLAISSLIRRAPLLRDLLGAKGGQNRLKNQI